MERIEEQMSRLRIKEQMSRLPDFIGKQVKIEYVNYGSLQFDTGELREVAPFSNVLVGSVGIPFIGYGSAVRGIALADSGDVIYRNPFIVADYDIRNDDDARYALIAQSFGEEIANEQRDAKAKHDSDFKQRMSELDAAAKAKAPELIESGVAFVKPELAAEWREYAKNNTDDGYSAAVIEGTVGGLRALANGKTPAEAESECTAAETGFQMGCVAKGLAHFSPRGDEFRAYWNRKYLPADQAAEADAKGGTVNPAILTIG
jgi:hypothetical protein